jgi:hypothetical protein
MPAPGLVRQSNGRKNAPPGRTQILRATHPRAEPLLSVSGAQIFRGAAIHFFWFLSIDRHTSAVQDSSLTRYFGAAGANPEEHIPTTGDISLQKSGQCAYRCFVC